MHAEFMFNSELNKYYATKVEAYSKIKQTEDTWGVEISKKVDKDEVITAINASPEGVAIKGKKIDIQGTTNIAGNFGVEEDTGIVWMGKNKQVQVQDSGIVLADGTSIVGGQGLLTNLDSNTGNWQYIGWSYAMGDTTSQKANLYFAIYIPKNFTILNSKVLLQHACCYYSNISSWCYARNMRLYKLSSIDNYCEYGLLGSDVTADTYNTYEEIENAFGSNGYTPEVPTAYPTNKNTSTYIESIDLKDYLEVNKYNYFKIETTSTQPETNYNDNQSDEKWKAIAQNRGLGMAVINVIGYMK